MVRTTICCWILLSILSVDFASAQYAISRRLPSNSVLNRYGLERMWWNHATLDPSRDTLKFLTVDEELLFAQASSGAVTAFDSESGKRLWSVQLGSRDQPSWQAAVNDRLVMVMSGTRLYGLERWTGEVLWQVRVPGSPSVSPVADDVNIYVGMIDGSIYALDLEVIEDLWNSNRLPRWSHNTIRWRYQTPETIATPPVTTGEVVLAASGTSSRAGMLYSIATLHRDLRFQFETDARISAPLALVTEPGEEGETPPSFVYMASEDFNLYCLNAVSGAIRWEFVAGVPIRKAPLVINDQLFVMPTGVGMYCLDRNTGSRNWWRPEATGFVAASSERVYASDDFGNLLLHARGDGAPLGVIPMPQFSLWMNNTITDRIFLATSTGLIVCLREVGRAFPLYHQNPDNRPILPEIAPEPGDEPADASQPADGSAPGNGQIP